MTCVIAPYGHTRRGELHSPAFPPYAPVFFMQERIASPINESSIQQIIISTIKPPDYAYFCAIGHHAGLIRQFEKLNMYVL